MYEPVSLTHLRTLVNMTAQKTRDTRKPAALSTRSSVASLSPSVPSEQATVTRVVGNDLVYVVTEQSGVLVFTPDKIKGYSGQLLKHIGIREGAKIDVVLDPLRHSVLSVPDIIFD